MYVLCTMGLGSLNSGEAFATTVCIPVKNGASTLAECLAAVSSQKTSFPFEIMCVDSGSRDDSLAIIRKSGARLYQIAPEDFGHGKTRNLAVSLSQTPFVAMLTQDAIPADDQWLEELIHPFRYDDTVAGVFGKHLPHHDCRRTEAFMLERHFAQFGAENTTIRIGSNPRTWAEYTTLRDAYCFFSDNNAALRKSVWELIPYPQVEFMEDQLWAAKILEAGYGKAWAPRAAVRHSHNYGWATTLRRAFDEGRFQRLYRDPPRSWSFSKRMEHAQLASRRDVERLRELPTTQAVQESTGAVARQYADAVGRYLGDNAPFLPRFVVRALSQHSNLRGGPEQDSSSTIANDVARYTRHSLSTRGQIDGLADLTHQVVHLVRSARQSNWAEALLAWRRQFHKSPSVEGWWTADVYPFLERPAGKLLTSRTQVQSEKLTLNWVVPAFTEGSGGHLNIFRMIHLLEKRGVQNRVYVLNGEVAMPYPAAQLQALIHQWFAPIEAPVEPLRDALLPADFAIATHWTTAYPVRALGNSVAQAYFVQDFEPLFFPASAHSVFAEATYKMGFYGIAAGEWLGELLKTQFSMTTRSFALAVDHELYWPDPPARPGSKSVFAYVRPGTPRRALELVALALRRVKETHPQVEIHTAGAPLPSGMLPFPFISHGILNGPQLRRLYSSVTLGVCASLTNYSLLPQEMAACGCPVIDLDGENTRAVYPQGAVILAERSVDGITSEIVKLLDDEVHRRKQVQRGLEYAQKLTWEDSADAVHTALKTWAGQKSSASRTPSRARPQAARPSDS